MLVVAFGLVECSPNWIEGLFDGLVDDGLDFLRYFLRQGVRLVFSEKLEGLLAGALAWGEAPLRQTAANGLAKIGGDEATHVLLESYRSGRFDLQLTTASAVAYHGDEASQKAIAEQILQSPLPENLPAKDVIVGYLGQAEETM